MIAQHTALQPRERMAMPPQPVFAEQPRCRCKPLIEPDKHHAALSREQLFEQEAYPHFPLLLRTAQKATGDLAAADDVFQEVCLQAWISFDGYTPGTNCRAWLFKILFYKLLRHTKQYALRCACLDDLTEEAQPSVTPLPEVLNEEHKVVQDALQTLASPFREVVRLAVVEEYSYREIAAHLNIPIGTVMSRLSRGRAFMKVALTQE